MTDVVKAIAGWREKGTPGPWWTAVEDHAPRHVVIAYGYYIAGFYAGFSGVEGERTPAANAALCAAAPAMADRIERLERQLAAADALIHAGKVLSLAAQTTGGTAGKDRGLQDAIRMHVTALTAYRTAREADPRPTVAQQQIIHDAEGRN